MTDLSRFRKVLIIRIDGIGDLICSTPAIRSLREALPGAHLTLVASPRNAVVLEKWAVVDNIVVYDPGSSRTEKRRFGERLRKEGYDLSFVMSPKSEAYLLAWRAGAPVRAGIVYTSRIVGCLLSKILLTHPLFMAIDRAVRKKTAILHEAEQQLRLVEMMGAPPLDCALEVPVGEKDRAWARAQVKGRGWGTSLIGFHLSPKWLSEGWTAKDMIALLVCILEDVPGSSVLLTHGPAESAMASTLAVHGKGGVFMMGNRSFGEWAGLLSCCRAVISQDTGSLHLASALGVPVVAVYGKNTFWKDSRQWAPWKVPHRIVRMDTFEKTCIEILQGVKALLDRGTM